MVNYNKVIVGVFTLLLSLSIVYIYTSQVKLRVDNDKTTFYVYINRWLVAGTEYNKIYNGTKLVYRNVSGIRIETEIIDDKITIKRTTPYRSGTIIVDTYSFDGSINDVSKIPISHTIEIFNGKRFIYQYEARNLDYSGPTVKDVISPQIFGKGIKIEWDEKNYWSTLYQSGILKLRYKPQSDYEIYYIRMFDPATVILYLNRTSTNRMYEYGVGINITANITSNGFVCLDIDARGYGTNYTFGQGSKSVYLTAFTNQFKFNDSTSVKNLTANTTVYVRLHNKSINLNDVEWNLTGTYTSIDNTVDQEFADGNLSVGILTNPQNCFDGDWGTYGMTSSAGAYSGNIYENYTIPSYAVSATFTFNKAGTSETVYEYCWNYLTSAWSADLDWGTGDSRSGAVPSYCFKDTPSTPIIIRIDWSFPATGKDFEYYEGKMTWNNATLPQNIKIDIGNDKIVDKNLIGILKGNVMILNAFNDSSVVKNFTIAGEGGSQINYINLPKQTNITSASLNISGFPSYTINYNDTEDAYGCSGIFDTPCVNAVDENWNSYARIRYGYKAYIYENYTIPTNITQANLTVKGYYMYFYCWNYSSVNWTYIDSIAGTPSTVTKTFTVPFQCLNGSMFIQKSETLPQPQTWQYYYEGKIGWLNETNSTNPYMNIGNDEDKEWNYTGQFNQSVSPVKISGVENELTDYLWSSNCITDYCDIPITIYSDTGAVLQLSNIDIRYKPNPISLNKTKIKKYLDTSLTVPFNITASQWGVLQIDDLNFDYYGSQNITITAYNCSNTTNNDTQYAYVVSSNFTKNLPYTFTDTLIFLPETNSSKNITPYGQTDLTPIFNVTWMNYDKNANLGIRVNTSVSCMNFIASNTTSKTSGNITLSTAFKTIYSNRVVASSNQTQVRLWLDTTNCTKNIWRNVSIELSSCCNGCMNCW